MLTMHRLLIGIVVFCSLILLAGCSRPKESIRFGQFVFPMYTAVYNTGDATYSNYIVTTKHNSVTGDILSIIQAPIDPMTLHSGWIQSNIQTLKQHYPTTNISMEKTDNFSCFDDIVVASTLLGDIAGGSDKDLLYFAQYFFIHGETGYVLMYSTPHEKSANNITNQWADIRCTL